jgi:branched-chain amino acid transport system substrate-binding protein
LNLVRRLGLLLLFGVLLAACQSTTSDQPLLVGAIYPLSGPQAPGGKEELAGVKAALELAGGRPIKLQVVDAATPDEARQAVDRLHQQGAAVIVGTYGSTLAVAAADRAEQLKTVYWETGAVADEITVKHSYVFRTVATGSTLGRMAAEFTSTIGPGRAVIVHVDDVYGRSVAQGEMARARQLGLTVVDDVGYNQNAFDPVALVSRIAADRPDYLWDVSYIDDGVAIWREVTASGLALKAAVGTSSAFCMPEFGRRLGDLAVGVFAADKPDGAGGAAALNADGRVLLAQARHAYSALTGEPDLSIPGVAGFVGGWVLFHEVLDKISGGVDADAIRHAAYAVKLPAGSMINGGGVEFAPAGSYDAGQNLRAPAVVGQWQAGVQMRVVYPKAYATAKPVLSP